MTWFDLSQSILRKPEYLGQYGKIQKIVVNRTPIGQHGTSYGAYVTFFSNESAALCVRGIGTRHPLSSLLHFLMTFSDREVIDERMIRASLGTTKYCTNYLRGLAWSDYYTMHCFLATHVEYSKQADCMYLHEPGDEAVSYTKEDMQAGKHNAHVSVSTYGLTRPSKYLPNSFLCLEEGKAIHPLHLTFRMFSSVTTLFVFSLLHKSSISSHHARSYQ